MKKVLIILASFLVGFLAWEAITWPRVSRLADENPKTTAFMERRKRELRREGKKAELDYRWVEYDRISPYLRRAVLVSEDNQFYEHEGVDVEGLREALKRDWEKKKLSHGGSTITQQLAKNLYLSPSRNPLRKVKELILARQMERSLSKKRILEIYLNVVEMGERVYGAEAAARFYFDKSARALTPREAALLAGCLPNPRVMNPGDPNKRLRARQRIILGRLRRFGIAAEKEVLTAKKPEAPPEPVTESIDTDVEEEEVTETVATGTVAPEAEAPEPEAGPEEPVTETETTTAPTETAPPPNG